jgi:hypothetical protein
MKIQSRKDMSDTNYFKDKRNVFGYKGLSCPSALTEHHAIKAYWGVEV